MVRFVLWFHDLNITFGDEDGARGASRRIYRRKRRYWQLYKRSGIVFCGELRRSRLEVATFLALIGAGCVRRNLLAPELQKDKSFDELKELLVSHYSPKPILIAERYKFHRRNQHESETVAQFVVELKRLALKSEFGTFLEEVLRGRLVWGLKSVQIQKKLLAERDSTLKNVSRNGLLYRVQFIKTTAFCPRWY